MMMIKLAAVSCLLALAIVSSEADTRLNCADVKMVDLSELDDRINNIHPCNEVLMLSEGRNKKNLNVFRKFQTTRECLCNMMQQQTIWDSFIDPDVEYVSKEVLKHLRVPENMKEEKVLKTLDERQKEDGRALSSYLEYKEKVTNACARLNGEFALFYNYVHSSSLLLNNPNLTNKMATYDQSFYKCLVAWRSCKPLGTS